MVRIKVLHVASVNGNIDNKTNYNEFRKRLIGTLDDDIKFTNLEIR